MPLDDQDDPASGDKSRERSPESELNDVDREIHLNQLRNQIEDHIDSGQQPEWPGDQVEDTSLDYLQYLEAWENDEFSVVPAELLEKLDIPMIPPAEFDPESLSGHLHKVILGLGALGCYLYQTNHLSDAELYEKLWAELLHEETLLMPQNAAFACHWSPIGSGSEDDYAVWLSYYATEAERAAYQLEHPTVTLPPVNACPSARDAHLPQAPEPPEE